jgi:4-aminobutyrate aminotransferase-like enzyme
MDKMENFDIEKDITVVCMKATSFPEGVLAAHKKLHSIVPFSKERGYYGISHGNTEGGIIYMASAEILEGEKYDLATFTIKKGHYLSKILKDYQKDIPSIGKTFQEMLTDSRIDKNGYCLEIYLNDNDMQCLAKLNDE